MNDNGPRGELVYEYTAKLTGFTDYGASIEELLAGAAPPPSGLRVDIEFEGEVHGKLAGRVKGIDYLNVRADGRMELDIKATITTLAGERIAISAGGVCIPQPGSPVSLLRENVKLTTAHPQHAWVNTLEFWAAGEADMSKREIRVCGYLPS